MTHILINGVCGHMGRVIADVIAGREDCTVLAGVDPVGAAYGDFPVYPSFDQVEEKADVIIDFSHPSALEGMLEYAKSHFTPVVIGSTGYTPEQKQEIQDAAKEIPVFFSFNMSLGVNLLVNLAKKAAQVLADQFDIEIVEKHHNQKLDAPSGTALMIADAIQETMGGNMVYQYDRHAQRKKREHNEIGIHSVRGGTIVGEHQVIFAGRDEVITLTHEAHSKQVFAVGAVNAAVFLEKKTPGLYDMGAMLAETE